MGLLMQNLRQLILQLTQTSESMRCSFIDLEASLIEAEKSCGLQLIIDPAKRFQQEKEIVKLDQMRQESLSDYWSATNILQRLIQLTEPLDDTARTEMKSLEMVAEDERDNMIDMSPPRVTEHREIMKKIVVDMLSDTAEGGIFFRKALENNSSLRDEFQKKKDAQGGSESMIEAVAEPQKAPPSRQGKRSMVGGAAEEPTMVAVVEFDPPANQAQMLSLSVGEKVQVLGQDGRGWWFGRTQHGKEGWFPPSYVQMESTHFSSAGEANPAEAKGTE